MKQVVYNVYIKHVNFIKLIDDLYHASHTCTDVYYTGGPTLNMKFNSFCVKIIPEVIYAVNLFKPTCMLAFYCNYNYIKRQMKYKLVKTTMKFLTYSFNKVFD